MLISYDVMYFVCTSPILLKAATSVKLLCRCRIAARSYSAIHNWGVTEFVKIPSNENLSTHIAEIVVALGLKNSKLIF